MSWKGLERRRPRRNRRVQAPPPPRPPLRQRLGGTARRARPYAVVALLGLSLSGGIVGGGRFLLRSPRFALRRVTFGRLGHAGAEDLQARLPFGRGDNLFRLDLPAGRKALERQPWVRAARLRRELPDTVHVEIDERSPACAVLLGVLYLADADGHLFKRAALEEAEGLVVVSGLDREQFLDDPQQSQALVREALAVTAAWSRKGRPTLSEASVHPTLGVSLFLRDGGTEVRLGRGDLERKLSRYDLVARDLAARGERARAIVLDSTTRPDRVAVRLLPSRDGQGG